MKSTTRYSGIAALALGLTTTAALATNGDILIGIGPISRALGGTGVAAPQDSISATFSNPAAMCISPACSAPQADFALTLFAPDVNTTVGGVSADSNDHVYPIPAIGASFPLHGSFSRWRIGISAYGVSGLGVDYRGTAIGRGFNPNAPISPVNPPRVAGAYTSLAVMKFAPSVAYAVTPDLSLGMSAHFSYATLDLGIGDESDIGYGIQLGAVWKPVKDITIGLTYISPQSTTFDDVMDFDNNGRLDSLELEKPNQVALGVAWTGLDDRLMLEIDGRWLNWSSAAGYEDFDWDDQWTVGLGAQYEVIPQTLFLRAGYQFGTNPVNEHNGWNGAFGPGMDMVNVQGKMIPRYYYETFRSVGFPAVVENHLTLGLGWQVSPDVVINVAYVHAFSNTVTETGTDPMGTRTTIRSELAEDSFDLGVTWRY